MKNIIFGHTLQGLYQDSLRVYLKVVKDLTSRSWLTDWRTSSSWMTFRGNHCYQSVVTQFWSPHLSTWFGPEPISLKYLPICTIIRWNRFHLKLGTVSKMIAWGRNGRIWIIYKQSFTANTDTLYSITRTSFMKHADFLNNLLYLIIYCTRPSTVLNCWAFSPIKVYILLTTQRQPRWVSWSCWNLSMFLNFQLTTPDPNSCSMSSLRHGHAHFRLNSRTGPRCPCCCE